MAIVTGARQSSNVIRPAGYRDPLEYQQRKAAAFGLMGSGAYAAKLSGLTGGRLTPEQQIEQARTLFAKDSIDLAEFERIVDFALGLGS